jgi:hypothetical protein
LQFLEHIEICKVRHGRGRPRQRREGGGVCGAVPDACVASASAARNCTGLEPPRVPSSTRAALGGDAGAAARAGVASARSEEASGASALSWPPMSSSEAPPPPELGTLLEHWARFGDDAEAATVRALRALCVPRCEACLTRATGCPQAVWSEDPSAQRHTSPSSAGGICSECVPLRVALRAARNTQTELFFCVGRVSHASLRAAVTWALSQRFCRFRTRRTLSPTASSTSTTMRSRCAPRRSTTACRRIQW